MSKAAPGSSAPRCVYVCAGTRVTATAVRQAYQLARACAASGHSVSLLLEPGTIGQARTAQIQPTQNLTVEAVDGPRGAHWYFCAEQADADRVFDTLTRLGWPRRAASIFFVDCAEAALTTLRAHRFLGTFRDAGVTIIDGKATRAALVSDPGTLPDVYRRWAVRYVLGQADAVGGEIISPAHPRPPAACPADRERKTSVSVVIPLFNQGRYLPEAVASALSQGVPHLQVVVVNDGSTDPETNRVFDNLEGITKVAQEHKGLSAARNAGIRHSSGDYIVPLDADDLVAPGFLASARAALDRHSDIAYLAGYARYTGLLNHTYVPAGFIPELSLFLHTDGKVAGMYRKAALEQVGGYDEDFSAFEDWDVQVALHRAGFQTDIIPCPGQIYRRHPESMSFTTSNAIRDQLVQQLLRKHAAMLSAEELRTALLVLTHFWKNAYEPSTSVSLQAYR